MTRAERERLIQSYLGGEMSSAEESDFFIQVALDKELRQDLKAQRTIESAFRKDRESEPSEHTALRSRVAMSLAASSAATQGPAQEPAEGPAAGSAAGSADGAGRIMRFLTRPGRWLIASAAALVLTVGVVFMTPDGRPAGTPSQNGGSATPGQLKNGSSSSSTGSVSAPMNPSNATQHGAGGGMENGAASKADQSKSTPPVSVSSDGVSLGSAAQAPRRTSQPFHATSNDKPRSSAGAALRRPTRTASEPANRSSRNARAASTEPSTSSIENGSSRSSDTRSADTQRTRKLRNDSIDAGVRIQLRRPK